MEDNWNKLIERYLNNELSAEGKEAFESELAKNSSLQQELELHQLTQDLVRRTAIRSAVVKRGKIIKLKKNLTIAGVATVLIAAIIATIISLGSSKPSDSKSTEERLDKALIERMNEDLQFANIDPQYFKFMGADDIFLSETGVLLSITEGSFLLNGNPYHGEAIVQWQEAQSAADIVKAGLSTMSGDRLLETQGMFSINAYTPDGKKLELSKSGIYVQVPVSEQKKDMMLFQGVKGENGTIDWQNPTKLERLPKPKSMAKMDLFPPKYEPKLNELKWFKQKEKRDSLYLSFDENVVYQHDSIGEVMSDDNYFSYPPVSTQNGSDNFNMDSLYQVLGIAFDTTSSESKADWYFSVEKIKGTNYAWVIAEVYIVPNWNIGPLVLPVNGLAVNTRFRLNKSADYEIIGEPIEPEPTKYYDEQIEENVFYHCGDILFKQKIRFKNQNGVISGKYEYAACEEGKRCLPPIENTFDISMFEDIPEKRHIPPSKVLAIWNKKMDGTILSTQDFEDRMKVIHNACDERVFDIYVNNLNTPLWQSDEKAVKLGYPEFQKFADERVGKLNLSDEHQKNIQAFYEKAIEDLRKKGKDAVESALKKERDWDQSMVKEREEEVLRKGLREAQNLQEEYEFNLANVCKQLGQTVGFQMHGGGTIVNIDKYVMDATVARKSTVITDPTTGKTAKITYNPFSVEVKEYTMYKQLYIYLFSDEINSYQRLDFAKGKLNYNLNGDMHYDAAIIGINENGYYFFDMGKLSARDFGAHALNKTSEQEFNRKISNMNKGRTAAPMDLSKELKWLFKEQANYVEQKRRRDNEEFRTTLYPLIYPCGVGEIILEPLDQIRFK